MRTTWARVSAHLSQSWAFYGEPIRHPAEIQRTIGHATRSSASKRALVARLRHLTRRPAGSAPPPLVSGALGLLGHPTEESRSWLVHTRPGSRRTIVHEIDGSGSLRSVLKLGDATDERLKFEAMVIGSLDRQPESVHPSVIVPQLLGTASDGSTYAMRTRLDLSDLVAPPYRWQPKTFDAAGSAIVALHRLLAEVPDMPFAQTETPTPGRPHRTGVSAGRPDMRDQWQEPLVPSHGDVTAWNLFLLGQDSRTRFAVIDFEECALRPKWWDGSRLLATLWAEGRVTTPDLKHAAHAVSIVRPELIEYLTVQCVPGRQEMATQGRDRPLSRLAEVLRRQSW